jgi:hypothetical protein
MAAVYSNGSIRRIMIIKYGSTNVKGVKKDNIQQHVRVLLQGNSDGNSCDEVRDSNLDRDLNSRGFPQFLHVNSRIVP